MTRRAGWSAELPAGAYPEPARAERLLSILAADGLVILKLPYKEQWASMKARLDEVRAQGLDGDLVELAGRAFVDDVRLRFADYGRVLGLTHPLAADAQLNQGELLRAAQQRVTEYVIQMFASIDPERPETTATALSALRPIADARDAALAARKVTAAEPDAPTPDARRPPARRPATRRRPARREARPDARCARRAPVEARTRASERPAARLIAARCGLPYALQHAAW